MKYGILLAALCLLSVSCNTSQTNTKETAKVEPSSEIPARREFPINEKADPCKDFYQYTCSKVNQSFKLREDRSSHTFSFSDSAERLLESKKTFLKDLTTTSKKLGVRSKLLRTIYNACMDEEAQKKEERGLVDKGFKEIGDLKSNREFQAFISDKVLSKDFSFIGVDNIANLDDPEWDDIYVIADLQSLPERSYYDKPDVVKDLEALMVAFFKTVSPNDAEARAKAVLAFEKEFSQSYPLPAEFRDLVSKKTDVPRETLLKNYPSFQLPGVFRFIPGRTKVRNLTPANFEFLNKALNEKPLQILKDVYAFHSLVDVLDNAYPEFFNLRFEFSKKHLGGPNVRPDRQERCTKLVMSRFGREFDAELLPVMFPNFPQEKVVQLAEKIRASLIKGIEGNKWLSPNGKAAALTKMKVAKLQLVKPTRDEDWDFNPPAKYSDKTPLENIRTLSLNLTKKMLRELNQPRNRTRWGMSPLTVNAYYSASDNKFVLPIGIMQYPFYDPALPERVNMAAMGTVIGHELGHGIDDKGSRYDERGRLKQWMTDEDIKNFRERGSRLGVQFKKAGQDPELTMGENVADLVGLTSSYDAAFPAGVGEVADKREFFTQYGRLWCNVARPKYLEMLVKTDSHSLGENRVNEQVKHQPGFAEAFQCKAGAPMTFKPEDVVRIW
jgi:putative endopeptidase